MAQLTVNMSELSREQRESEERARRADEALGQHLAEVFNDLRHNFKHSSPPIRIGEERADKPLPKPIAEWSRRLKENSEQLSQQMREHSEEGERLRRELNIRIANRWHKIGTWVEDLIAPHVRLILAQAVNCTQEPEMEGLYIGGRHPDGRREVYDVVAVSGDYLLICEGRSELRVEYVRDFGKKLAQVRDFLPYYADKQIIGALATFYVDPSLIKHGERHGLIMLGVIDGLMQILNEDGFTPKVY